MTVNALVNQLVVSALAEDLAGGDITTEATVPTTTRGLAVAIAKEDLVMAGTQVFVACFLQVDPSLRCSLHHADGAQVTAGAKLCTLEGSARSILLGERTALNFLQRLSGIATLTHSFIAALPAGTKTRISDTRKTTPLLRSLERQAVRAGGGHNHRDNLGSAVLIKDNHIAAAGGLKAAMASARAHAPHSSRIEVEVDDFELLEVALRERADIIMLDNFSDADVARALELIQGRALVEVSGGITVPRVAKLAALGVDIISVGALTHSARAVDISLDLELHAP